MLMVRTISLWHVARQNAQWYHFSLSRPVRAHSDATVLEGRAIKTTGELLSSDAGWAASIDSRQAMGRTIQDRHLKLQDIIPLCTWSVPW